MATAQLGDPAEEKPADLAEHEHADAAERVAPQAAVVYEAIRREGSDELKRPTSALFWSGLAAGLSMGFSFIAEALLRSHLPDAGWRPLIAKLGYSVGFIIIVLGRQQLFTENTLTPILPLLRNKSRRTLGHVLRLWVIVLLANAVGTIAFAWVLSHTAVAQSDVQTAFGEIGREMLAASPGEQFVRAIFAGWLIATMVWLMPFAEAARVWVIVLITYLVGLAHFGHIIAGSVTAAYTVFSGLTSLPAAIFGWWIPVLLGNVIGGVLLVAALNHAQVAAGKAAIDT